MMKIKLFLATLVCSVFIGAGLGPGIYNEASGDKMLERIWINTGWCVNGGTSMTDPGYLSYFDDFMDNFGCRFISLQGIEYHITDPEIIDEMKTLGALDDYYEAANIALVRATFLGITIKGAEQLFRQWAIDAEAVANWYFVQSQGSFEGYENRGELASYIKKWRCGAEVRIVDYEKRRD